METYQTLRAGAILRHFGLKHANILCMKAACYIRYAVLFAAILTGSAIGDDDLADALNNDGSSAVVERRLTTSGTPTPTPNPAPKKTGSGQTQPGGQKPPQMVPPTSQNEAPPQAPPPQQPPQTPPGETPQNNITGIRQGDVIIMRQNQEQVRIWNEQQDAKTLEKRLDYEGRHGQQIPLQIDQPQGYTTPVVMGEVTDAQGNVWERVKVNAKDVPQYLDKTGDRVYVLSVGGPEQGAGKKLQSGEVAKDAETGKTLPQAITGAPTKTEAKVEAPMAPVSVTTFFKGLSDKMVDEGRAKDKRELASVEEEEKKENPEGKPLQPKPGTELAVNNDIAIGSGGGVADLTAVGTLATELFRLKQKGAGQGAGLQNASAQVMTAGFNNTSGDRLGAEVKSAPKRALASVGHDGTRNTVKNLVAILAGIVTIFLFREIGLFSKLKLATSASGGRASWLALSQFIAQMKKQVSARKFNWLPGGKKKTSQATNATSATRLKHKV